MIDAINGPRPLLFPDIALSGFVWLVTSGHVMKPAEPLESALGFCERLLAAPASRLIFSNDRHWSLFTDLCRRTNARGGLVPDAFLAAFALEHDTPR